MDTFTATMIVEGVEEVETRVLRAHGGGAHRIWGGGAQMTTQTKRYIGDSVYADFDGYHIILTTENGLPNDPSNRIALEPAVIDCLILYREWLSREGDVSHD